MSEPHTRGHPTSGERRRIPPQAERDLAQAAGQPSIEERERLLDEELDDTFPASDPPSWTMGGSVVGTLRH